MAVSTRSTGETMRAPGPSAAAPSAAPVAGGAAGVVSASLPVVAVDASLPTPPYRQIVDAVLAGVASGSLARGDRLPPVRALAAELGEATAWMNPELLAAGHGVAVATAIPARIRAH